ncbi:MAG: cysteine--tRNA ligase [Actinobacteria bacterium]|uniref:Cysteine--tRNA ligase n=1 Tax=freshwater metagenome TaxID=449393 RepID=A0A6J5YHD8_9ZZZZ|nr:cysteine--tRNA ligase [Actinomycetota bacterium]
MSAEDLRAAIGKRATIRLHGSEGGFRDIVGVLQSETSLINRRGELIEFQPDDVAFFRVIPVFNRRDADTGQLRIYDTLTREVKSIESRDGFISIYCCGPTVYRDAHVGNLRTFLLSDLIARTLTLQGIEVQLIQNITDVGHMADDFEEQDKMLAESEKRQVDPFEIAREFESRFHRDLALLNIRAADRYPRASENMDSMQKAIGELIEKKSAYVGSDGCVYFDATSFDSYGAISGNRLEALKPGHRYEYKDEGGKRFHADWALWKLAGGRTQMIWESPWGAGFPGWHIECSAMSIDFLDASVDIHVGGIDLRFPHHENERAQSNSLTGHEVVQTWVHGEHLLFEGRKMSKSAGNVVLLGDLIDRGLDPLSLRFALLENRYRSQMDLSWESLEAAHSTIRRWRKLMSEWGTSSELKLDNEITDSLATDLDTPRAMQRLRAIEKDMTIGAQDKRAIFLYADQVLGLALDRTLDGKALTDELKQLLQRREIARSEKNWAESDALRNQLESAGLEINDSAEGQSWSWK